MFVPEDFYHCFFLCLETLAQIPTKHSSSKQLSILTQIPISPHHKISTHLAFQAALGTVTMGQNSEALAMQCGERFLLQLPTLLSDPVSQLKTLSLSLSQQGTHMN